MSAPRFLFLALLALAGAALAWFLIPSGQPVTSAGSRESVAPVPVTSPAMIDTPPPARDAAEESTIAEIPASNALPVANFARRQEMERAGFEAAGESGDAALQHLATITTPADHVAFLRGIFARLGEGVPADALRTLRRIMDTSDREIALQALIEAWRPQPLPLTQQAEWTERIGPTGALLMSLIDDPTLAVEAARALLDGPPLVELLSKAASREAARDPQNALSFGQGLNGKDHDDFVLAFGAAWASADGKAAWSWALGHPDASLRGLVQGTILESWAEHDPKGAAAQLPQIADPGVREHALQMIGGSWGGTDTQAAFAWANALAIPQEREKALASIRGAAPVGIGAVLVSGPEGYPVIAEVVPGGPLSSMSQFGKGARIAAVRDAAGNVIEMKGQDLDTAIAMLRGAPGTPVSIDVIPPGGTPADRRTVVLTRQQLIFKR